MVKVCVSVDCPSPTGNGNSPFSWFTQNVGDGSVSSFTVAHNLDSLNLFVSVREISTGILTDVPVTVIDANSIRLDFSTVPAINSHSVLVLAVRS